MVNPVLQQNVANSDEPFTSDNPLEGEREQVVLLHRPNTNNAEVSSAESLEDNDSSLDDLPSPTSQIERHKRTQKLAKFFGVSQLDVTPTVMMQDMHQKASDPPSISSQSHSRDVEVNVKIAGRRLWGLSPDSVEFKNAHMTDAIQQLRTLKAG